MIRRIGILAAALVAVLSLLVAVVLPPIFGSVARATLDDIDIGTTVGQVLGAEVELFVTLDDWDAGWFSSTASLSLHAGVGPAVSFRLFRPSPLHERPKLEVMLRHGPVIAGTPSGLGFGSIEVVLDQSHIPLLEDLRYRTGVDASASLGVLFGFGGGATVGLDVPGFGAESDDRSNRLRFGGLQAVADVARDAIDMDVEFDGFRLVEGDVRLDIGRAALAARMYQDDRMPVLWLGDLNLDSDGLAAVGEQDQVMEVGPLRVLLGAGIVGDMLGVYVAGDVSELRTPVGDGRSGVHFGDLIADVSLEISADSVARLTRSVRGQGGPELLALIASLDSLIRERMALDVRQISFAHEDRSASAALRIDYRGDELELPRGVGFGHLLRILGMVEDPRRLPVRADLEVAFDRELLGGLMRSVFGGQAQDYGTAAEFEGYVRRFEDGLRALAQADVLEERRGDYSLRVEIHEGEWLVNGERIARLRRGVGEREIRTIEQFGELVQALGFG